MSPFDINDNELKSMSLGDHLEELRLRLMLSLLGLAGGMILCLVFGKYLLHLVALPYEQAMAYAGQEPELQTIQLPEKFVVYFKTSFVFGLVVTAPWIFYQMWLFISAGLYRHERKYVYVVAPLSAALFIGGALFFVTVIAKMTMIFLVKFNTGIDYVTFRPTLSSYVNFVLTLTLVFGAAFQLPIAIVAAERMGLVSIRQLGAVRKYVVLVIAVVAAVVTPPDVVSQIALGIPLYALFESSILVCRLLNYLKKRKES